MATLKQLRKTRAAALLKTPTGSNVCQNNESTQPLLARLRDTRLVVFDTETSGLDWAQDIICGYVFTFSERPDDTWYVPVRHKAGGNINSTPFEADLKQILETRRDLHIIAHHCQFDLMFLHGHGIGVVGTLEDTEVNAALLNEHANSYSLEACAERFGTSPKRGDMLYRHLAEQFGGEPTRRAQMQHFWELAGSDVVGTDYACGDGVATWELREKELDLIEAEGLAGVWELESHITRVVYRMTKRGVRIDQDRLGEVADLVRARLAAAEAQLPAGFNARSNPDIEALLRSHGITDWPLHPPTAAMLAAGKPGNPKFNKEWLATVEPGRAILAVRKLRQLDESFIKPLIETHIKSDGRVHSTFNQLRSDEYGTVTGRFSSNDPNLQQVPKRDPELGMLFRSAFVPDNGMIWSEADLAQAEPRLLAHYSGAKVLVEGYLANPPVDAHTAVALAAGLDREDGKRLNQTLLTGGGLPKIRTVLGDRADQVYNDYFRAMPEIRVLQRQAASRIKARGYVISLLGRRARLDDPRYAYKAINRLLQCGNADIQKENMVRIDQLLEETGDVVHMLNTVHDSICLQYAPEHEAIAEECYRLMVDWGPEGKSFVLRVPMGLEIGVGPNWAVATYGKNKRYMQ